MVNNLVVMGDWIADVYIKVNNIDYNQEIINEKSFKGYYSDINLYPGGGGFVLENIIRLINNFWNKNKSLPYDIKYLLAKHKDYTIDKSIGSYFNLLNIWKDSVKYMWKKYNNRQIYITQMRPFDYISDYIKPTVKMRFYSTTEKRIYFRFDYDNDIKMRTIHCDSNIFSINDKNDIVIVDYNKGYFTEESVDSLYKYIKDNNIKVSKVFINTKPNNILFYKNLFKYLIEEQNTLIILQLNEKEFEPTIVQETIKDSSYCTYVIVTRGKKSVFLYDNVYNKKFEFNINSIDNVYTTSGCGDVFFANIIYNILFNEKGIKNSIKQTIDDIHTQIMWLNNRLF